MFEEELDPQNEHKKKRKMFSVDVTLNTCSLVRFSSRLQNLRATLKTRPLLAR